MRKYRDEDIIERMVKDNYLAFSRLERGPRKEKILLEAAAIKPKILSQVNLKGWLRNRTLMTLIINYPSMFSFLPYTELDLQSIKYIIRKNENLRLLISADYIVSLSLRELVEDVPDLLSHSVMVHLKQEHIDELREVTSSDYSQQLLDLESINKLS